VFAPFPPLHVTRIESEKQRRHGGHQRHRGRREKPERHPAAFTHVSSTLHVPGIDSGSSDTTYQVSDMRSTEPAVVLALSLAEPVLLDDERGVSRGWLAFH
jgi:hypothetical protein